MFSNINNQLYGRIYRDFYNFNSLPQDNINQKIQQQVIVNSRIKEAFSTIWKNQHVFRFQNENNHAFYKKNYNIAYLFGKNKRVFPLDRDKENEQKNQNEENKEKNKEDKFLFFIEIVLDELYVLHPEISHISKKAKNLLFNCAKKWKKSRENTFKSIFNFSFDRKE